MSRLNVAELVRQSFAGGKVEKAVWLVVPNKNRPCGEEEAESCDACGDGASRASRCEYDSAPDCRAQPAVEPKHQPEPEMTVARKDEGDDLLWEVGARAAEGAEADELIRGEGLDAAGLAAVRLVEGDDEELALGRADLLCALPGVAGRDCLNRG